MIRKLGLLHYLSKETYMNICHALGLDDGEQKTAVNEVIFPDRLICRVNAFNILYRQFGHIWFLDTEVDFQKCRLPRKDFGRELFDEYAALFGVGVMADFPPYEQIVCGYIEFAETVGVSNADNVIKRMAELGHPTEQLDEQLWAKYVKPKGTNAKIEFFMSKADETHIKTLACCHGTALKKRIKDASHHITMGVRADKMIEAQTEREIMDWLYTKYKIAH